MRVPLSWLRSLCDPGVGTGELAERLSLAGLEVARVERFGLPRDDGYVVGRVEEVTAHPNADRLRVCRVDVGGERRTIVCGAPNVRAGLLVPVALPGAVLADGRELRAAELRGVRSEGMILAEDELGLGDDHSGIVELAAGGADDGVAPGRPLREVVPLSDEVLELEVSPNRPDCLGVLGVAREVHALWGAPLDDSPLRSEAVADRELEEASTVASVTVSEDAACLRFAARIFEDVTVGPSPLWLRQRLVACGMRPINNVVDVTNYVMLLLGQPLHAFDLARLAQARIEVRPARGGERITTLDGNERELPPGTTLVCDGDGPAAIAGVMGGERTEVRAETTRVLLESATWVGSDILRSEAQLGLRTEASGRFEKQLHPELAAVALAAASRLLVELAGARLRPGTIDVYPRPAERRTLRLRPSRVRDLLGLEVPQERSRELLARLGFESSERSDGELVVTVPWWRDGDVQREVDLVEEIARVHGLDKLPTTLPARRNAVGRLSDAQRLRRRVEDFLRDRGLFEAINFSFTSPELLEALGLADTALALENPLSEEQSLLRPLLLPGLVDSLRRNAARGRPDTALFEIARTFTGPLRTVAGPPRGREAASERLHVAAVASELRARGWRSGAVAGDFFAVKALVEGVLACARADADFRPTVRPFLHPGRSAAVVVEGEEIGFLGELHPTVVRRLDLAQAVGREPTVAAFELDLGRLAKHAAQRRATFAPLPAFPAVVEDLAVVARDDLPAAELVAAVRRAGGELVEQVSIFDVFRGAQIPAGHRSVAMRIVLRAHDRTLTESDAAEVRERAIAELAALGASIRG